MRFIIVDENNKITQERHGKSAVGDEIQNDTAVYGEILQDDGTSIPDPNELTTEQKQAIRNKQELYEEYKELKEMKGESSFEAKAAKSAYLEITDKYPGKSRYDLEQEIKNANQEKLDALDAQMLELIEGGLI